MHSNQQSRSTLGKSNQTKASLKTVTWHLFCLNSPFLFFHSLFHVDENNPRNIYFDEIDPFHIPLWMGTSYTPPQFYLLLSPFLFPWSYFSLPFSGLIPTLQYLLFWKPPRGILSTICDNYRKLQLVRFFSSTSIAGFYHCVSSVLSMLSSEAM